MAKLRVLSFLLYASLLIARGASQAEPAGQDLSEDGNVPLIVQRIEGRVQVERLSSDEWVSETKVVVDGGRFYGFLRSNGEFEIHNVPPGSYLVEVVSPNHAFDPVRVDISSKSGKIRARKVNMLKASSVTHVPYPLRFKAEGQAEFFEKREKWNVLSTLKNPMVRPPPSGVLRNCAPLVCCMQIWLMIGPMLIMLAMPKLMKSLGPESQKVSDNCSRLPQRCHCDMNLPPL